MSAEWTDADLDRMAAMLREGATATQIADKMGIPEALALRLVTLGRSASEDLPITYEYRPRLRVRVRTSD